VNSSAERRLLDLIDARRGHFQLESGHHGELWLDLDTLLVRPARLAPFVRDLAQMLAQAADPDAICGPLLGGGLIASATATVLDTELFIAEPVAPADGQGELFRARYAVRDSVRSRLRGRRIAVIDDVVNAGSATRATIIDLRAAGADVVAVGALVVLGTAAADCVGEQGIALVRVAAMPNRIWAPTACALCESGEPLEDLRGNAAGPLSLPGI
jgi:orotate phosphoribosyltransferase